MLLSLRSSLSAILRPLFPHLGFRHLSLPRFVVYPACSVRPTVRTFASCQCSRALHVALYPATFQRLTRYFLSSSRFLHLSFSSFISLSLFFSLSLYLSFECSLFISFLLYLRLLLRNYFFFFFWIPSKAALFRISASYTLLVSYSVCISPKTFFFNTKVQSLNLESPMYFYHSQLFILLY